MNVTRIFSYLMLTAFLCFSHTGQANLTPNKSSGVYVAVTGGGFRAHNVATSVFAGLLDHVDDDIYEITKNINGFSGNSGGVWFLSQLLYSNRFNYALINLRDDWFDSGYMFQLQKKFQYDDVCEAYTGFWHRLCESYPQYRLLFVMASIKGGNPLELNWIEAMKNTVYYPYGLQNELKNKTMGSVKVKWAINKEFIVAATLLSNKVKIEGSSLNRFDYSIKTNEERSPFTLPLTFSSSAPSVFLPDLNLDIGYQYVVYGLPITRHKRTINKDMAFNILATPLLDIAGISSAALAGLISFDASDMIKHQENAIFNNMAPAVSLLKNDIKLVSPNQIAMNKSMADQLIVRLADGGYNDNTSMSFLMRSIQSNNITEPFKILLIHNQITDHDIYREYPFFNNRLSYFENFYPYSGFGANILQPKIFKLLVRRHMFQKQAAGLTISFDIYHVKTRDERFFNIKPGQQGEIHVLNIKTKNYVNYTGQGVIPVDKKVFDLYRKEFDLIRSTVSNELWPHLENALEIN